MTSGSQIIAPDNFAFDPEGNPVSINSSGATSMNLLNAGGTTYDGGTTLLEAATPVTEGSHTVYLSIFDQGDMAYDSAAFVDNLRLESVDIPSRDCEPGAKTTVRRPLIFLHGITGSFLQDADGNEVWPDEFDTVDSTNDEHLDVLKLQADGRTPADSDNPISVMTDQGIEGVIDQTEFCVVGACQRQDAYNGTFDYLESDGGYTRGEDLFPFAFDWRLSAADNAQRLLEKIDTVRSETGVEKVNIMAHSQGGLVTSSALADPQAVGKVDRVVTLGTPYLGATKALGVLDYQDPCQADPPLSLPGCILNREKAQELVTNWPGFLELLPAPSFYEAEFSAVHRQIDDDDDGSMEGFLPFDAVREQLADRNLTLIDNAATLHRRIDAWAPADPDVKLFRVVGDASATILRVIQYEEEQCDGYLWWRECKMTETFQFQMGNGDGTVPLHSADVHIPSRGFDLRGGSQIGYVSEVGHGELPRDEVVLEFATGFLAGSEVQFASSGFTAQSINSDRDAVQSRMERAGVTETPQKQSVSATSTSPAMAVVTSEPSLLSGTELLTRGDLTGQIQDYEGGRLGVVDPQRGVTESTVHGGNYTTAGSTASYFTAGSGDYLGRFVADSDGEVGLTVRNYADDAIVATSSTPRFPVRSGAVLTLAYASPASLSELVLDVDDDADGSTDRTISFLDSAQGKGALDTVAPQSSVSVRRFVDPATNRKVAEVTINSTDEGGSGVERVEYALDASERSSVYQGPVIVPAHGELYVRAIDRAGNVEAPYQVVVLDDRPSRRDLVTEFHVAHVNEVGYLEHPGDVDQWGLELAGGRTTFQLTGLKHDYDLVVTNASGTVLGSASERGQRSERLVLEVPAGRYFLVVKGYQGAHDESHAYRVNVNELG